MEILAVALVVIAVLVLLLYAFLHKKRKPITIQRLSNEQVKSLSEYVDFYNNLDEDKKSSFESRVHHFLAHVRITGVNTEVEELDKVLIAASAIIPIFGFPDWEYMNLNEVLLYPQFLQ